MQACNPRIARLAACIAVIFALGAADTVRGEAPPQGFWITADGEARIRMSLIGDSLSGSIAGLRHPKNDILNPEKALRSRPLLGLEIFSGRLAGAGKWTGRIYDPASGKSYTAELKVTPEGNLNLRAFLKLKLLGATITWIPAERYFREQLTFLGRECADR